MSRFPLITAAAAALLLGLAPAPAHAQGGLLRRATEKAKQRIDRRTDQAIDKGLDAVECAVTDAECAARAQAEGRPVRVVEAPGAAAPVAFVNYDFVPGDRVLFVDDFAADQTGDFPRRLKLKQGNVEVAEVGGARYLRATSYSEVLIPLPSRLPDRFTLELDFMSPGGSAHQFVFFGSQPNAPFVEFRMGEGGLEQTGGTRAVAQVKSLQYGRPFPVRVMADGKYVKVYLGGTRVANVPEIELGRDKVIRLQLNGSSDEPAYIGSLRVAEGGKDLYTALSEKGRVATQGILFDTGSDRIRPESKPTLEQIAGMLREHGDLRLSIEGHTDNVGEDAANQSLSERRAQAVKAALESSTGSTAPAWRRRAWARASRLRATTPRKVGSRTAAWSW